MRTWLAFVALSVACGGSPQRPEPVATVPSHKVAHYQNQRFKIGAVIELADADHPVIKLDGDTTAERLDRRGDAFVDRRGRQILRFVDGESVVVFVHGGDVGVELGRDRDL